MERLGGNLWIEVLFQDPEELIRVQQYCREQLLACSCTDLHVQARKGQPYNYPQRSEVIDYFVDWKKIYPKEFSYTPADYTSPVVGGLSGIRPKWADPECVEEIDWELRCSYEGDIQFDGRGRPLNPKGRTGLEGRGLLGKWGPNMAADSIVVRNNPLGKKEVLLIQRNNGAWALPGGMIDGRESPHNAALRELFEETSVTQQSLDSLSEENKSYLFSRTVYAGYVDDPRNTDNAWIETTAFLMELDYDISKGMQLASKDKKEGIRDIQWVSEDDPRLKNLYASHSIFVAMVLNKGL